MADENVAVVEPPVVVAAPVADVPAVADAKAEPVADAVATETPAQESPVDKAAQMPAAMRAAFDRMAFEKREAERKARQAEGELAAERAAADARANTQRQAPGGDGQRPAVDQADIDRMVTERAQRIADDRIRADAETRDLNAFNTKANEVYEASKAKYGSGFETAVENIRMLGGASREVLETMFATDEPGKILYQLGNDPDKAAKVLAMPPAKMAIEFARIAMQAGNSPKIISQAPAPGRPVAGTASSDLAPRDDEPMDSWIAKRRAERERNASNRR